MAPGPCAYPHPPLTTSSRDTHLLSRHDPASSYRHSLLVPTLSLRGLTSPSPPSSPSLPPSDQPAELPNLPDPPPREHRRPQHPPLRLPLRLLRARPAPAAAHLCRPGDGRRHPTATTERRHGRLLQRPAERHAPSTVYALARSRRRHYLPFWAIDAACVVTTWHFLSARVYSAISHMQDTHPRVQRAPIPDSANLALHGRAINATTQRARARSAVRAHASFARALAAPA